MRWVIWLGLLYWPVLIIAVAVLTWLSSGGRGLAHTTVMHSSGATRATEIAKAPSERAIGDPDTRPHAREQQESTRRRRALILLAHRRRQYAQSAPHPHVRRTP